MRYENGPKTELLPIAQFARDFQVLPFPIMCRFETLFPISLKIPFPLILHSSAHFHSFAEMKNLARKRQLLANPENDDSHLFGIDYPALRQAMSGAWRNNLISPLSSTVFTAAFSFAPNTCAALDLCQLLSSLDRLRALCKNVV